MREPKRLIESRAPRAILMRLCAALILLLMGRSAATAEQGWVDFRVAGPFICRADFSLNGHEAVFSELAEIQQDLLQRLGVPPGGERIEIYLFQNRSSYESYVKRWFPKVPSRRALYIKNHGPGMVLVYLSDQLHTDLRHECTHALLHASLPMVPLWLDEGLAEYYEVPPRERSHKNPHHSGTVWSYRFGRIRSMQNLEEKQELKDMGRGEYRNAWAWVHFMVHGPPIAREELVGYLTDIRLGRPPGKLSDRLARKFSNPKDALVQHFKTF
ncbi:MAG: hypothetical protein QF408_12630 [Pirellulales bacterium]|nr:hypothetical protein [Pirellulales bacterium]